MPRIKDYLVCFDSDFQLKLYQTSPAKRFSTAKNNFKLQMWIWFHVIYYVKYCAHNAFSFLFELIRVVTIKTAQVFHINKLLSLKDHL